MPLRFGTRRSISKAADFRKVAAENLNLPAYAEHPIVV
jgi:hypothetical protein